MQKYKHKLCGFNLLLKYKTFVCTPELLYFYTSIFPYISIFQFFNLSILYDFLAVNDIYACGQLLDVSVAGDAYALSSSPPVLAISMRELYRTPL